MLFTLWGCIRYYGYVGVPIITHNFNSTSTVDHVLLIHLRRLTYKNMGYQAGAVLSCPVHSYRPVEATDARDLHPDQQRVVHSDAVPQ
jgi:hypothetical protein